MHDARPSNERQEVCSDLEVLVAHVSRVQGAALHRSRCRPSSQTALSEALSPSTARLMQTPTGKASPCRAGIHYTAVGDSEPLKLDL